MEERNAAEAASPSAALVGYRPPPITQRAAAAVIPEMAFVTDMSGE